MMVGFHKYKKIAGLIKGKLNELLNFGAGHIFSPMKAKQKKQYEPPTLMVLWVKLEGFICLSQTDYSSGNLDEND